jgi:hypothetical protein
VAVALVLGAVVDVSALASFSNGLGGFHIVSLDKFQVVSHPSCSIAFLQL